MAVVTGGGTGIGLMITQALVSNGAKVYVMGRRAGALEAFVKQYSTDPGKVIA
jgi:NADP-dependent 3-hydroxy acid dehydrogenase YdfG